MLSLSEKNSRPTIGSYENPQLPPVEALPHLLKVGQNTKKIKF